MLLMPEMTFDELIDQMSGGYFKCPLCSDKMILAGNEVTRTHSKNNTCTGFAYNIYNRNKYEYLEENIFISLTDIYQNCYNFIIFRDGCVLDGYSKIPITNFDLNEIIKRLELIKFYG